MVLLMQNLVGVTHISFQKVLLMWPLLLLFQVHSMFNRSEINSLSNLNANWSSFIKWVKILERMGFMLLNGILPQHIFHHLFLFIFT